MSSSVSATKRPTAGRIRMSLPTSTPFDDEAAAVVAVPRVERSVGESQTTKRPTTTSYDADDLEIPSFLRRK